MNGSAPGSTLEIQTDSEVNRLEERAVTESGIMTVLGPVPAEQLGVTLAHEHCLVDLLCWFVEPQEPSRWRYVDAPIEMSMLGDLRRRPFSTTRDNMILDDENLVIEELSRYQRAGGGSLVDVTCYGLGRDVRGLQRIARATGLHIVASTGFYVENTHPVWVGGATSERVAELMIRELVVGVGDTGVRCGLIGEIGVTGIPRGGGRQKVGAITDEEEKVLRAAAFASLETGVSVSVHTDPVEPRGALPAVAILTAEGVEPSRIVVGHVDQVNDLDYHLAVADTGAFVEYDSFGRERYSEEWGYEFDWGHDSWRVRYAEHLIGIGHGDQLLFSQDVCLKTDLRWYGGNGYSHVLDNIVPTLRSLGVSADSIDRILVENPRRALTPLRLAG